MTGTRRSRASRLLRRLSVGASMLLLGVCGLGIGMGIWSRRDAAPTPGSVEEPCGAAPNCVSSVATDAAAVAPLRFAGAPDEAWSRFVAVVVERASEVLAMDGRSLHATFDSDLFGFRDDLLAELDRDGARIHVRSSSRVGHSDLGANRARVEALRAAFEASGTR